MSQTKKSLARKITKTAKCGYLLFLPKGYKPAGKRWPLILFLHGAGQRGDNLELVKEHGVAKIVEARPNFPFIVVSPQCPADGWWSSDVLAALLDEVEEKHRVDKKRIYLTGLSMGGFGTWNLAMEQPHRFAALVPICGRGNPLLVERIAHLPIWVFHGAKDAIVPISNSHEMVRALREQGAKPKFTVYPDAAHDSWTRTYDNPRLYEWMLSHAMKGRIVR
jgi:predicted peptidase